MRLLTAPTPNGWKVSILVEELREAGPPPGGSRGGVRGHPKRRTIRTRLCSREPQPEDSQPSKTMASTVMESCAILQYLAEKFPSPLLPQEIESRFEVLQWVYWQAANVGPVFGNKLSYTRYMDDVDDDAKAHPMERFATEAQRLLRVLSRRLTGRNFICGPEFSIADIALYPWVRGWKWSKIPILGIPHIEDWVRRVRARPGVERGLAYGVPKEEIDQWSAARKAQVAAGGSTMAATANLDRSSRDSESD